MSTLDSRIPERQPHTPTTDLIDRAYRAASDGGRWPSFFAELGLSVGGRLSTLVVRGSGRTCYVALDAAGGTFADLNPGRVFETKSLSRKGFAMACVGNELVEDWTQLQLAARDAAGPDGAAPLAVEVFTHETRTLDPEDRELLRTVLPHLQRALGVYLEIEKLHSDRDALSACLDLFADGVLLLDDKATILHANRSAGIYLGGRGGLTSDEGKLSSRREAVRLAIRENLKQATSGRRSDVRCRRLAGGETLWVRGIGEDRAVMFICGKPTARDVAPALLEEAFGITAAEARVAALFAAGQSLREIAESLGISLHTVRQHMKKIQAKTDTHRQASLAQRVLQVVPRLAELR